MLDGCSSRGGAPVYNRTASPSPAHANTNTTQRRPPAYARTYYLVQPGDTLYSIAWRQNLSYHQLAGWNGIRPPAYQIFPGQRLRLKPPAKRHSAARARQPRPPAPKQTQASTRVKPASAPSVQTPKPVARASKPATPASPKKSLKLAWDWPTNGRVVQTFSAGDDNRKGIWIHGRLGQPVTAAEAGRVVYAGNGLVGYGNLIIIKHDRSYLSAYGYNSKLLVGEGDKVSKGDVVAHMGSQNIGGQPVLHFEIRRQGKPVNPLPLLPRK
ncbi:MAG: peptidoglycan DD-metalloendopeptidase family protein [Candidatus Thiodiazotropha sp.]